MLLLQIIALFFLALLLFPFLMLVCIAWIYRGAPIYDDDDMTISDKDDQ